MSLTASIFYPIQNSLRLMSTKIADIVRIVRLFAKTYKKRNNKSIVETSPHTIRVACIFMIKLQTKPVWNENYQDILDTLGEHTPDSFFDLCLNTGKYQMDTTDEQNSVGACVYKPFFRHINNKINIHRGALLFLQRLKTVELKEQLRGNETNTKKLCEVIKHWLERVEKVHQSVSESTINQWIKQNKHSQSTTALCRTVVKHFFTNCRFLGSSQMRKSSTQIIPHTGIDSIKLHSIQFRCPTQSEIHGDNASGPCTLSTSSSKPPTSASSIASSSSCQNKRLRKEDFERRERKRRRIFEVVDLFDSMSEHPTYKNLTQCQKSTLQRCILEDDYINKLRKLIE